MKQILVTLTFCLLASVADIAQTASPNQSAEVLQSNELNSTVLQLYDEGKYDEALPLAKRALELREKVVGPGDQTLIPLLINLGEIYRAKKKPGEAYGPFQRALDIGRRLFGPEDVRTTRALDRLAYVTYEQRNEKEGERLLARSLAIKEKSLGPYDPEVAQTAFNLGEMYRLHKDYAKAEAFYQQAIRIAEKKADQSNPELVKALEAYANVLFAQNKTDEGLQAQQRIATLSDQSGVIQGGVLNGKAVRLVQPAYPIAARSAHAEGQVQVQVLIDEKGKVIQAKAIGARDIHPALVAAAEDAARHSLFTPTLMNGQPVKVNGMIIYRFSRQG